MKVNLFDEHRSGVPLVGILERKARERAGQQERRRMQILDAAKKVFHERGFSAATVDDIARFAELSPGALYLYFKNKDDIYVSLNLQLLDYLHERLVKLKGDGNLDPLGKVDALKGLFHDVFCFDRLILVNLFHLQASEGLQNLPAERSARLNGTAASCLRILSAILEEGMDKGLFVRLNPTALADILWSTFTGTVLWEESKRMMNPAKDFLKSTLDLAIDIFKRGILAEGRAPSSDMARKAAVHDGK
jgi:AcrR family transcriptional regulator